MSHSLEADLAFALRLADSARAISLARFRVIAAALGDLSRPDIPEDHPALPVARGEYDLAVFFILGPWDVAAPSIVVREAGGRFSNLAGASELGGGALFSNGRVHDAALKITAR